MIRSALSCSSLLCLVVFSAACEPRTVTERVPVVVRETVAAECPPAPPPTACPAAVVCPAAPTCPAPTVCAEPPPPVELSVTATPTGTFRSALDVQWTVSGCTPSGAELLGEAGQVVALNGSGRASVEVINLTRSGSVLLPAVSLWARVSCADGREALAGPVTVANVMRATNVTGLAWGFPVSNVLLSFAATPTGGWAGITRQTQRDGTHGIDLLRVWRPDGREFGSSQSLYSYTLPFPARNDRPWMDGRHAMGASNPLEPGYAAWIDVDTGQAASLYRYDSSATSLPPEAFVGPLPAALAGWTGPWAPTFEDPAHAWIYRDHTVARVELTP